MATSTRVIGVEPFAEAFEGSAGSLPGSGTRWLTDLRRAGMDRFAETGLPTNRLEAWKYTSLRPLARAKLVPTPANAEPIDLDAVPTPLVEGFRAVFVDGRFSAEASTVDGLPQGLRIESLADVLASDPDRVADRLSRIDDQPNALLALNLAMMGDGLVLDLDPGVRIAESIELLWVATGGDTGYAWYPRNLIRIGDGAEVALVERSVSLGSGAYLANAATDIEVGKGASLNHYKMQDDSPSAWHLAQTRATVEEDALYDNFVMTTGASLSRNQLDVTLTGERSAIRLDGTYLLRDKQHADHTSQIEHRVPNTTSRQVYKGAIADRARGVFQGKIVVDQDAQKTDGHQMNRALMLSDTAEIDSKPMLEIYADDVKCSHGATVGDLDTTALFYLRSRGIDEVTARSLLVKAFLAEVIDELPVESLRQPFLDRIDRWLEEYRP